MSSPFALLQDAAPSEGLRQTLRLLDMPALWVVVLIIVPLFALVTWIGYGRESISTPMRVTLSTLRLAAFVLLFLVLARPVLVERREDVKKAEVLVLVDDSASMQRKDAYTGDDETRRVISGLTGRPPADVSRLELASAILDNKLAPLLVDGEYELRTYGFSTGAEEVDSTSSLYGRGKGTHVGDALTQVLAANRGRHITDMLVISDGRSNGGLSPLEAGRAIGAAGIPVHTLVIGDTRPEKSAVVELVESPSSALEGDELAVTVRVLGRGIAQGDRTVVSLEELEPGDDAATGRLIAEEEVDLTEAGERVVLVAPPGRANLRTGERRFRVSVPALDGETMVDDNQVKFSVHVSAARMRVLYVDGYPRWEYRYLKNMLLRADKNLQVQCYLISATRDFPQESSADLPALREIPVTRQELLDRYDVIILGDVNPYSISPDPARCESFLTAVREFVEAGGGLLFQAGEYHNPSAFVQTPLEDVLPIVLDPTGLLAFEGDTSREFRPLLENPLAPHEILRLHAEPETNRRLWEDSDGLRGFYWYSPVKRPKPGTQVLLRHPRDRNPADGELYPLLVSGYFPAGRTLFIGVDSTWMWRYHYGDRYHERFWRNSIRWLALGRLKSGDRRYRLETTRSAYDLEEHITLEARVLDEDFQPSDRETQEVFWSGPDGRTQELALGLANDRPGVYRGSLQVDRPGLYRAWIESAGQRLSATEFEVLLPSRENADPSPDPLSMALVAEKTGGRAVTLGNWGELADELPGGDERREPLSSSLEDAWDRWSTLLIALGLLSAEWILRKRAELV